MSQQALVKVIKRSQREPPGEAVTESPRTELTAREKRRELAATVNDWVSEFRETRLAQQQELTEQFGRLPAGSYG